jgi:transcription initiation factor IIE alpha subunit
LFERSARPENCPDCGKERVEYADIHEKITYLKSKEDAIAKNVKSLRDLHTGYE